MGKENNYDDETNKIGTLQVLKESLDDKLNTSKSGQEIKKGMKKLKQIMLIFVIGLIAGICLIFILKKKIEPTPTPDPVIIEPGPDLTVVTIQEILAPAGELITTKYYYTDVTTDVDYKKLWGKDIPFTKDEVLMVYSGEISIGIELDEVQYEIDNEKQCITIILPECEIKSNYIDKSTMEFHYTSDSVFNESSIEDDTQKIAALEEEKAKEILANEEFMEQAKENTKYCLEKFLTLSDATKEYEVIFK